MSNETSKDLDVSQFVIFSNKVLIKYASYYHLFGMYIVYALHFKTLKFQKLVLIATFYEDGGHDIIFQNNKYCEKFIL